MRIVFFKRPKPKRFEYKPRYWDEEKERLEERKKNIWEKKVRKEILSSVISTFTGVRLTEGTGTRQKVSILWFTFYHFAFALFHF